MRALQDRGTASAQVEAWLQIGNAKVQAHRLQRLGLFIGCSRPGRDITIASAIDYHLGLNRHESGLVADNHTLDLAVPGDHIGDLGMVEHFDPGFEQNRIGGPFETFGVTPGYQPIWVHLDKGEVAVNVVTQLWPLARRDHPHAL